MCTIFFTCLYYNQVHKTDICIFIHVHIQINLLGYKPQQVVVRRINQPFWKRSLFSSVPWWDQMWFSKKTGSTTKCRWQPNGGLIAFSHHESFKLPHTPIHTTHTFVCMFTINLSHDSSNCITIIIKPITHPSNNYICKSLQINEMYMFQLIIKTSSQCL